MIWFRQSTFFSTLANFVVWLTSIFWKLLRCTWLLQFMILTTLDLIMATLFQLEVNLPSVTTVPLFSPTLKRPLHLDRSVLENHHISSSWSMAFSSESLNIFINMNTDTYKKLRERIIGMVLATDMTFHFSDLAKLKGRLSNSGIFMNFFNKS